jgi:hypothetical protein
MLCLLLDGCILGLLSYPENGGRTLLRIIRKHLPYYTESKTFQEVLSSFVRLPVRIARETVDTAVVQRDRATRLHREVCPVEAGPSRRVHSAS